jgi:glycosyltransferase involved in cell wall biosynthesis
MTLENKNILVITSTFPTFLSNDTTPPFVYELSKSVTSHNQLVVTILTPHKKGTKTYEELDNLKIYRFKYGFSKLCDGSILVNLKNNKLLWLQLPFFFFFYLINLIKIVKREKIQIIHAHWLIPQGLVATIYKKFINKNIKILCTIHGSDLLALKSPFYRILQKFVIKNVDSITTVSHTLKAELLKIITKNKNIQVLPMGVDSNKFNPNFFSSLLLDKYGDFLLSVGRLSPEKGIKHLISVMPNVIAQNSCIKLIIIGDGPLKSELQKQVTNLKLNNHIIFLGHQSHKKLPSFFATTKIFILPSDREGLGLVCVEALLSKTCVVASNLSSISDVIINNQTGIQINVRNKEDFSRIILKLLEDKKTREKKTNG